MREYLEAGETTISNLVLENYAGLGMSDAEFLLWLQLFRFQKQGNTFPDLKKIAQLMNKSVEEIYNLLNALVEHQALEITSSHNALGELVDSYSLYPLINLIEQEENRQMSVPVKKETKVGLAELNSAFEEAFGRLLNSIELEQLRDWVEKDGYSPELILLALKEAVLNQVRRFRYIERILMDWKTNDIQTREQVEEAQKRRKMKLLQKEERENKNF